MNLLIKNGLVIDPAQGINGIQDVAIVGNKFAAPSDDIKYKHVIDAFGCIVTPGLIDYHLHMFYQGADLGIDADVPLLSNGVTSAADAGTAGVSNYGIFVSQIVKPSKLTVKSFIYMCPAGQVTSFYHETVTSDIIRKEFGRLKEALEEYKGQLLGLKIRFTKDVLKEEDSDILKTTLEAADKLGVPIVVHTTNPPLSACEIASMLRKGDVFCHMYHGRGNTLLDENGRVYKDLYKAQERGVIFDASSGKNNYSNAVAKAAIDQEFLPDVISSDLTANTVNQYPIYSLPYLMSKHLNMGIKLEDIIRDTTTTPAKLMGMLDERGSLKPGSYADLAVFKIKEKKTSFYDFKDEAYEGDKLFVPQMTIKEGEIVFRQIDF